MNNERMNIVKEICNTEAIGCRALNKSSLVFDLMETFGMDTENITISEIPVDWDDQILAVFEYGGDWYEFAVGISADGSGQYFEEVRRWTEGGDGELMPFSYFSTKNFYRDDRGVIINLDEDAPISYFENRNGEVTYVETNNERVLESLCCELIAKKLNQCRYITRIKRTPNYDGTQTITITYAKDCGGGKRVYRIGQ